MDEINDDLSYAEAEKIFKTTIAASGLDLSDPGSIKAEIASSKECFSKLKFQYLEQESRDKFLSLLFFKDVNSISQRNIDALANKNAASKADLKRAKNELQVLLETSEATAEDVISMNRKLEERKPQANASLMELEKLQEELKSLLYAPENESYKMLLDLNKMIDSHDVGPSDAIRIAQDDLHQEKSTLEELAQKEVVLLAEESSGEMLVTELQTKLSHLQKGLEHSAGVPSDQPDPEQVRAQWLRELNALLQKFAIDQVKIRHIEGNYTLFYRDAKIVFNEAMEIVVVTNQLLSAAEVRQVNQVSRSHKTRRLSKLISRIILQRENIRN
ncbi:hypothetical protein JCM33374_g5850 [Metschnikowia sp. JCM 33374]|nr:hypothetical protein JCM33374_g5850 [Metschnikowia sp. JCM 33374]